MLTYILLNILSIFMVSLLIYKVFVENLEDSELPSREDGKSGVDTWERPEWSTSQFWNKFYSNEQLQESYQDRNCRSVIIAFILLGRFGKLRILDAGCGVSILAHIFCRWGHDVTAIDLSTNAIQFAKQQKPSELEIVNSIPYGKNWHFQTGLNSYALPNPEQTLRQWRDLHVDGGSIKYVAGDWNVDLEENAEFDLIVCKDGLQNATIDAWYLSFKTFHQHLAQGGVMLVATTNRWDKMEIIEEFCLELGFILVTWDGHWFTTHTKQVIKPNRYAVILWPNGFDHMAPQKD